MGLIGDLKGPLLGLVGSVVAFVVIALVGLLDALSALTAPGGTVLTALEAAIPYVVGLVIVGLLGVGFLGWGLYRVAAGVVEGDSRLLRNERVASLARYVERENAIARQFDLADRVEPSEAEKRERERERLREEYVDGNLSEAEFERKLDDLLDDERDERTSGRTVEDDSGRRSRERD